MKTWWNNLVDTLSGSFWFVPVCMAIGAVGLAVLFIWCDIEWGFQISGTFGWFTAVDPQAVRTLLSTVTGSLITTLGTLFSITIVALTLASSQFGPRLLRSFMHDRGNQFTLGTFIATFVYCLIVMSAVGRLQEKGGVPNLSVMGALVLMLASVGVLIYFIHHIATLLQASQVLATVGRELDIAIDRLYPHQLAPGQEQTADVEWKAEPERLIEHAWRVASWRSDYLMMVDRDQLLSLAEAHDLVIQLPFRTGRFVVAGDAVALVWPRGRMTDPLESDVREAFYFGTRRTPTQDVEFPIDQLAEIAVRALSPAINDPFTAMQCVDRLGAALSRIAKREMTGPRHYGNDGRLRLVMDHSSYRGLTDQAFNQIREYGRDSVAVTVHLLEALATIARHTQTPDQRAALRDHARMIHRSGMEALPEPHDRKTVTDRFEQVTKTLNAAAAGQPMMK